MNRRWIIAILATAVVWGACVIGGAPGQEGVRRATSGGAARPQGAKPGGANLPPARPASPARAAGLAFDGKLVAMSVRGASQGKLLQQARFVEIKGRTFLVGKEARAAFSIPMGSDAYVAWDAVESFYLFDNAEQYESALRDALQSVQGSMDGMLGEIFPGTKISGVHVNSSFCEAQSAPQHQGYAIPITPAPDEESESPLAEEAGLQAPDGRWVRMKRRVVIDEDGRKVVRYEQIETLSSGQGPADASQRSSTSDETAEPTPSPAPYAPGEEQSQPARPQPKPSLPGPMTSP